MALNDAFGLGNIFASPEWCYILCVCTIILIMMMVLLMSSVVVSILNTSD